MNTKLFLAVTFTGLVFFCRAQGLLGQTKEQVLQAHKQCDIVGNYGRMVAFKCDGRKQIFYFSVKDSTCDMVATDLDTKSANDTLQKLLLAGYKKAGTKYIEPFMVSKNSNHQKYPSRLYSNGTMQYCFMPVSLNGKSAELNAVIIMFDKHDNFKSK